MVYNRHLFEYVSVLAMYNKPGFDRVRAVRGFLRYALSYMFRIPVHELAILDFYSRYPIPYDKSDVIDGMVIQLEHVGVTIDPAIICFFMD
ncbi:hypothetical protein NPIL_656061 [Nephila pilipes]|uniref:Uncharacterized protein n=1 Tax=Nephila pilipes TaxID=299642 RepID=A0A8X6PSX0_NEPPI|nr:hypothetical protein NPIL_656061 [Nephila pilipes]